MSSAPFVYKDLMTNTTHKMVFFGGMASLVAHANGGIEPVVGWAVIDSGKVA